MALFSVLIVAGEAVSQPAVAATADADASQIHQLVSEVLVLSLCNCYLAIVAIVFTSRLVDNWSRAE